MRYLYFIMIFSPFQPDEWMILQSNFSERPDYIQNQRYKGVDDNTTSTLSGYVGTSVDGASGNHGDWAFDDETNIFSYLSKYE